MVNAQKKLEEVLNAFIRDRVESNETDMYCSISKMKLKTFANQKAKQSYKISDNTLTLKADIEIFARLLVTRGKCEVNMKEVLTYSLGALPWALATLDGELVKTEKSKLVEVIECDCAEPLVSTLPHNCVRIFDGMVLIQHLVSTKLETFAKMSEYLMKKRTSNEAKVIYFVTDQYNNDFLKSIEPLQRRKAAGSIRVQLTRRDQKRPKQFKKFLNDGANKVDLVKFLLKDWSDPERFRHVINDRIIFVTIDSDCYCL